MKNKNAFTLIELLVVIAILAGFMSLLVPNFMQVRIKSRDSRRKGDLKNIQKALELYRQSQTLPVYPPSLPTACVSSLADAGGTIYMTNVPYESLTKCGTNAANYYYKRTGSDNYVLAACLEDLNDPDGVVCPADFFPITNFSCPATAKCYQLLQP